jgi:hypothetical protein
MGRKSGLVISKLDSWAKGVGLNLISSNILDGIGVKAMPGSISAILIQFENLVK